MKHIILDGASLPDSEALHRALETALDFPAWYGHNLDALYDCLTDLAEPPELEIKNGDDLQRNLGAKKMRGFLKVCYDARVHVTVDWEPPDKG